MDSRGKSSKQMLMIKSETKLEVEKILIDDVGRIFDFIRY